MYLVLDIEVPIRNSRNCVFIYSLIILLLLLFINLMTYLIYFYFWFAAGRIWQTCYNSGIYWIRSGSCSSTYVLPSLPCIRQKFYTVYWKENWWNSCYWNWSITWEGYDSNVSVCFVFFFIIPDLLFHIFFCNSLQSYYTNDHNQIIELAWKAISGCRA